MRIIDFRLRPPLKGFLDMVMYADLDRTARMAAGIEIGVVPGRQSPVLGTIANEDVRSIRFRTYMEEA